MQKKTCLVILLMLLSFSFQAFAHDTDIYVLDQSMQQVPPDALIVLDLSGSMNWTPAGDTMFVEGTDCWIDGPFYPRSEGTHTYECSGLSQTSGPKYGDSESCSGPFYKTTGTKLIDGNNVDFNTNCSKLAISKRAVFTFLDADGNNVINQDDENKLKMRMGYMRFYGCGSDTGDNYSAGCNTLIKSINTSYSNIYCNSDASCTSSSSSSDSVSGESASGGTPVAPSLSEAKLYFDWTKDPSRDNAANCRQKFVILITDGNDTLACSGTGSEGQSDQYKRRRETVAKAKALANAGYLVFVVGFGAIMPHHMMNTLNWSAYYGGTDNPNVTNSITSMYSIPYGQSYPSGITSCMVSPKSSHNLGDGSHYFASTSENSGVQSNDPGEMGISGYAFLATSATELRNAIESIRNYIIALLAKSTSYVAPVVPISQMEKTSSGNRMYLGMFKPTTNSFWKGNIKKYGIATENTETLKIGDIIDAKNPPELVMTPQNKISDTAKSYWSSVVDKGEVDMGGVGEKLLARDFSSNPRSIYTYMGTNSDLTHSSNAFTLSNGAITTTTLDTTDRDNVIKFIHGWDAWDWNKNGVFDEKRDWILGAFIHSRPTVIHYSDRSVIYAGANDGMLHAFDDSTGEELWAFIPPNLLPYLKQFKDELSLQVFVDGSPKAYIGTDRKVVIFGERRGGNRYVALDVTNPISPTFLWEISPSRAGYEELGQTWSTPRIGKIKDGTGEKWVAFVSGGYDDTHQDPQPPLAPPDAKGTAIYVVDIVTGDPIWVYSKNTKNANMTYSIPSDIAPVDVNGDGKIDRLYVGDMGGRIWRFDIGDVNQTASWTGKMIFSGSGKIFYPPDVTLEKDGSGNFEMLFFGTGDRENPKDTSFVNTLYAIKDKNPATPLTEGNDLVDVTLDLLQDPNASQSDKLDLLNQLKVKKGWYIRLNQNSGEKCLAESVVFAGTAYYTTFSPTLGSPSDICLVGEGQGRIYALKYQTGNAAFNLDDSNDIGATAVMRREDRVMGIGTGIPSGVILTVIGSTVIGYAGVAGGVYSPLLSATRTIIPTGWRMVF